ncbi:MAG: CDP-glycerol glycerophosphotransferase family protein [Hespellia sp.]|nr:CDP-glycerol glycerophosphotransferase family protein [Hespellia sp.]
MLLLYIDPGTGSMLFSILIGIIGSVFFLAKKAFIKLKFLFAGGKVSDVSNEKVPYLIFSDSKRYWNVFKPICDEFEKRQQRVKFCTASEDDAALKEDYKYVDCEFLGEGNKAFAKLNLMSASVCLSTTPGLDVYQWKRSKNIDWYAHTFHSIDEGLGYRMFGLDFYDAVLMSGTFQERYIRTIEEMRGLKEKELSVVGITYMDELKKKALTYKTSSKKDDFTVLLAPSWGPSAILSVFGEKIIDALLDTGYQIVVRPHPQSVTAEKDILESLQEKYKENDRVKWNFDNDNFRAMYDSDILITDFSGIIFDYAFVLDKPVLYADTHFDASIYDAAWLDEKRWRFTVLDKLGKQLKEEEFPDLKSIIADLVTNESYQKGRQEVRAEAWQYEDHAAEKIVDYMMEKYAELNGEQYMPNKEEESYTPAFEDDYVANRKETERNRDENNWGFDEAIEAFKEFDAQHRPDEHIKLENIQSPVKETHEEVTFENKNLDESLSKQKQKLIIAAAVLAIVAIIEIIAAVLLVQKQNQKSEEVQKPVVVAEEDTAGPQVRVNESIQVMAGETFTSELVITEMTDDSEIQSISFREYETGEGVLGEDGIVTPASGMYDAVGQYTNAVIVTDTEGNVTEQEFVVSVIDNVWWSTQGVSDKTYTVGSADVNFMDGITWNENIMEVTCDASQVDLNVVGQYPLIYNVVAWDGTARSWTVTANVVE